MKQIIRALPAGATVVADHWQIVRDGEGEMPSPAGSQVLLPLPLWRRLRQDGIALDASAVGVWIACDDEYEAIAGELLTLPLIAVDFPAFRDGRGYSVAYLLRSRFGYRGELRAIGDVLRDQLFYMQRCGFDSFAPDKRLDEEDAQRAFATWDNVYQRAADRRRTIAEIRHEA